VGSISRAVNLCEATLAFGKAEEPPPQLTRVALARIVDDVIEAERLAAGEADISFSEDVPGSLTIRADQEQLWRILTNLVRNARQAILASGKGGEIRVQAAETDAEWTIAVEDTGPGLPPKAREHLFQPFQGGTRKEGTGLGLAIAAELVRGHGGRLELLYTGPEGTGFAVRLPKAVAALGAAAAE
jgi:signal transduction histidine kinase